MRQTLLAAALFFCAPTAMAATSSPLQWHENAVLGCDNIRSCELVQMPDYNEEFKDDFLVLAVQRNAASDAQPTVTLSVDEAQEKFPTELMLKVDGSPLFKVMWEKAQAKLESDAASQLLKHAAKGKTVTLEHDQRIYASTRLKGFSAALRAMDEAQARAGTTTAIVARGTASASSIPSAPAMPTFEQRRPGTRTPRPLTQAEQEHLLQVTECEGPPEGSSFTFRQHMLDEKNMLVLVPCWTGAYNYGTAAMIADESEKKRKFQPAPFDAFTTRITTDTQSLNDEIVMLTNAYIDPESHLLWESPKGRGIGDCGSISSYAWDGSQLRLVERSSMDECRGVLHYIGNWVAKPMLAR